MTNQHNGNPTDLETQECQHCEQDHRSDDCPTLRGVKPLTAEEMDAVVERLQITPGIKVMPEIEVSDEVAADLEQAVKDYQYIESEVGEGPALEILDIVWMNRAEERKRTGIAGPGS